MLLGAAIFPETSISMAAVPEKMAIVAVRQRWRRSSGEEEAGGRQQTAAAFGAFEGRRKCGECRGVDWSPVEEIRMFMFNMSGFFFLFKF